MTKQLLALALVVAVAVPGSSLAGRRNSGVSNGSGAGLAKRLCGFAAHPRVNDAALDERIELPRFETSSWHLSDTNRPIEI